MCCAIDYNVRLPALEADLIDLTPLCEAVVQRFILEVVLKGDVLNDSALEQTRAVH